MKRFSRSKKGLALTIVVLFSLFYALALSLSVRLPAHAHLSTLQSPRGMAGNFAVLDESTVMTRDFSMRLQTALPGFTATVMCTIGIPCSAGGVSITIIGSVLGTAGNFAVLGGSTITNTGPTVVTGDLGVSPGTAVTGFLPGIVIGTKHSADPVALQAQSDVTVAYMNAVGKTCDVNLTGQDLGGKVLTPGVYCFTSSAQLTGQLTLNGQGNPASVFLFTIGSTLTTASNASVLLINGAQACNIFWQVGSSATIGTNTHFTGNILALTSITVTTGVVSNGGIYAHNGAVTLDTNTITRSLCPSGITTISAPIIKCTIGITMFGWRRGHYDSLSIMHRCSCR